MGLQPRRYVIRARQRSRSALPAFANHLMPQLCEIGIDRFQLSVMGSWRTSAVTHPDAITADIYRELFASYSSEVDWFCSPERTREGVRISTRSTPHSSLSLIDIAMRGWPSREGSIRARVTGNPTRTLAHLIADYGGGDDFLDQIYGLTPSEFFAHADGFIPRGLGTTDNWVADPDALFRCLGRDPFSDFLPIFTHQLQSLIASIVAPTVNTMASADGTDIVMTEPGLEVRLQWGGARVPQIESYFERHHGQAIASVRSASAAALMSLDRVAIGQYRVPTSEWVERVDDCLSMGTPLNDRYKLSVYAKSPNRIRFEVKRLGRGRYDGLGAPETPQGRLLDIFQMERENVLSAARWPMVGRMFDEPDQPSISDATRLCSLIAEACYADNAQLQPLMSRMIEDGGVSRIGINGIPSAVVERLCAAGVLERISLGRRDHRRPVKRVALKPEYRAVIDALTIALVSDESPTPPNRANCPR